MTGGEVVGLLICVGTFCYVVGFLCGHNRGWTSRGELEDELREMERRLTRLRRTGGRPTAPPGPPV